MVCVNRIEFSPEEEEAKKQREGERRVFSNAAMEGGDREALVEAATRFGAVG